MIHENELTFEFYEFDLVFTFELKEDELDEMDYEFYNFNPVDDVSKIEQLLSEIEEFTSCEIKDDEYLGWREGSKEVSSITNSMFSLIKKIKKFASDAILDYHTDVLFGDHFCQDKGSYTFSIGISEKYWWDIKLLQHLFEIETNKFHVPQFYLPFFYKSEKIKDEKDLKILSTSTKVRRLGYFKILSLFLEENKKVPKKIFNKKFERFCVQFRGDLEVYPHNKGLISVTKSGISAKPYTEIAENLGLLYDINGHYHSGKNFKVFECLSKLYSKGDNVFKLGQFDKMFFLESIIKNDFFYFRTLLEVLFVEENIAYSTLKKSFQNQLISHLERYKRTTSNKNRDVLRAINTVLVRIKNWERAETYLEHLLMPRLNWMLDLGILEGDTTKYSITKIGERIFQHFCCWNDIQTEDVVSPRKFLDLFMVHFFNDCFNNNKGISPILNELLFSKIATYIDDSFNLFKTLAPNRVTASQALNYTKYRLYFDSKIVVGYDFIAQELANFAQNQFVFKYQEQYQDGYVQKINN